MSRTTRAFRRNAATHHGGSVEFAELLDTIATTGLVADPVIPPTIEPPTIEPTAIAVATEPNAEIALVMVADPTHVSRFADAGLDDDRLPMRSTARRSRRH
jgi:hypothetical protein